jgi:hypothetical protein
LNPVLLDRREIDASSWDLFINTSRQNVVYGYSWYLDIVCEDWKALVWPSRDDFQVVMPLPVKYKYGFPILYQPYFCQYLGIFSSNEINVCEAESFLAACTSHFSYISSYSFNPENYNALSAALESVVHLEFQLHKTMWLALNKSPKEILHGYTPDRRQNLRKGCSFNWVLQKSGDPLPLIRLFQENHAAGIDGGVSSKSYQILKNLIEQAQARKVAELWYAVLNDKIHAGIIVLKMESTAIYIFNSASAIGRDGNARTYLLHEYFIENAESNLIFDFESPQIKSIHSFYKSFGGDEVPFITIQKRDLSYPLRQLQFLRKAVIKAKRDLYVILCKI